MDAIEKFEVDGMNVSVYRDDAPSHPRKDWDCHLGTMVCWHKRYNLGDEHSFSEPDDMLAALLESSDMTDDDIRGLMLAFLRGKYGVEEYRYYTQNWKGEHESWAEWRRIFVTDNAKMFIGSEARCEALDIIRRSHIVMPLFLFDHSGITMNTTGFSCPWDSGQVGYIFVSHAKLLKEFGKHSIEEPIYRHSDGKKIADSVLEYGKTLLEGEVETYDQYLTGDVWGYIIEDEQGNQLDSLWDMYGYDYCVGEAKAAAMGLANGLVGQDYSI